MGDGQGHAPAPHPRVRALGRRRGAGVLAQGAGADGHRPADPARADRADPAPGAGGGGGEPSPRPRRRHGAGRARRAGAHRLQDPRALAADGRPRGRRVPDPGAVPARGRRAAPEPRDASPGDGAPGLWRGGGAVSGRLGRRVADDVRPRGRGALGAVHRQPDPAHRRDRGPGLLRGRQFARLPGRGEPVGDAAAGAPPARGRPRAEPSPGAGGGRPGPGVGAGGHRGGAAGPGRPPARPDAGAGPRRGGRARRVICRVICNSDRSPIAVLGRLSGSEPGSRRDSRKSRAWSCAPATPPRHTWSAAGRACILCPPARHAAHS